MKVIICEDDRQQRIFLTKYSNGFILAKNADIELVLSR